MDQNSIIPSSVETIEYIEVYIHNIGDDNIKVTVPNVYTWVEGINLMQRINGIATKIESEIDEEANLRNIEDKSNIVPCSIWINELYVYFVDINKDIQRVKFNNINPEFPSQMSITHRKVDIK